MPSIFGRFITVTPKPSAWDRHEDITKHSLDNIARDLQVRLKSRIDTGIDLSSALLAGKLTVQNKDNQLIISSEAPEQEELNRQERISDLFQPNAQEPYIEQNKMVFRQVAARELERKNMEAVKSSFEESMYLRFKNSINDAIRDVLSKHPELIK